MPEKRRKRKLKWDLEKRSEEEGQESRVLAKTVKRIFLFSISVLIFRQYAVAPESAFPHARS